MNAGTGLRVTRVDRRRAGPSLGALVIGVGRGDRSGVTEEGESGDGTGAACISRPRSRWRMSDLTDKCDACDRSATDCYAQFGDVHCSYFS